MLLSHVNIFYCYFLQCINVQLVDHNDSAVMGNMFVGLAKSLLTSSMPAVVTDLPSGTKGSRSKFQIICLHLLPQVAQFILYYCRGSPVTLDHHLPSTRKPVPIPVFIPHPHVLNAV